MLRTRDNQLYEVSCARCDRKLRKGEADWHHNPPDRPFYTCARCTLCTGFEVSASTMLNMERFPVKDPFGDEMIQPYVFQQLDAGKLAKMRSCLVNHEMGTGKSVVTILGGMRDEIGNYIFCPASIRGHWQREIMRWRPSLLPTIITSRKHMKMFGVPKPGEVVIATYDMLPGTSCKRCKTNAWTVCSHADGPNPLPEIKTPLVMIADEVHYLQRGNLRRERWDALRDRVWEHGGFLYGLTGTEASNTPNDTWMILSALNLERAAYLEGRSAFHKQFSGYLNQKKGERYMRYDIRGDVLKTLRPVRISRLKKHVLAHLPPVHKVTIPVELDPSKIDDIKESVHRLLATRRAWNDAKSGVILDPFEKVHVVEDGKKKAYSLKNKNQKEYERRHKRYMERIEFYFETPPWTSIDDELKTCLQQVIEDKNKTPMWEQLSTVRMHLSLAKLNKVEEIVHEHERRQEPLAVFCQHRRVLQEVFAPNGDPRPGWGLLLGGMSQRKADDIWTSFQRGEIPFGVGLSITAFAEGINLTRAGSLLFVDLHWNPSKNNQAAARVLRPGSERHESITIYTLEADHVVDRLVTTTVSEKQELSDYLKDEDASLQGLGGEAA